MNLGVTFVKSEGLSFNLSISNWDVKSIKRFNFCFRYSSGTGVDMLVI
jgi:hypothetical protein